MAQPSLIAKKTSIASRKNVSVRRHPDRGERMATDDGSCLSFNLGLGGAGFGDSRESGACSPTLSPGLGRNAGGDQRGATGNGLSLVQEPADLRELFLELRAPICRYLM